MKLTVLTNDLATLSTPALVLGSFNNGQLTPAAGLIDRASNGALNHLVSCGDLNQEIGASVLLYALPNVAAERVLLVNLGKADEFDRAHYAKSLKKAFERLADVGVTAATLALPEPLPAAMSVYHSARAAMLAAGQSSYRYTQTKAAQPGDKPPLDQLTLWVADGAAQAACELAITHAQALVTAVNWTRDLANLPGNICTPSYLAEQAQFLATQSPQVTVEILDADAMAALGMGAMLGVARGSREPAKLIVLRYAGGAADAQPVVLVGKGLTFDAGGISLKPANDMDEMKYDMSGGASVLGTLRAVAELCLPINVIGVIPATENLPGGAAYKPGDVLTSLSGQTIEVLNTDAEGRLILCDALTYCERFNPAVVLDMATLTGACVVALGHHPSGLFTHNNELAATLTAAGETSGDRVWRLPLWKEFEQQLDSNFADMANVGGRDGGAITAALFLGRFTKKFPAWAHLDIAGTAWVSGKEKGATGRPVPLLVEFLLHRCGLIG
ncbi:leucyl aminopeptidase [Rhodoferax sp. 4810]|uniref:Probable cytosol aminopeptidase n=1 Tax=Thiospirillum jenense TaxID=1653858 RepID=A0A839H9V5_9GAMM|nr:leucyl aminopeptidase [Thiospirillum jenense]MBB1073517.1 leucyl aminopeptidase [Rhodoferax jenense]MBB1126005.1 leucyl aminopeptidase [Thiospirillum jenense]